MPQRRTAQIPGVNVVGPLRAESGVGEASRAVVAALDAARIPVLPVAPPGESPSRQQVPFDTVPPADAAFPITVLCLTALETPGFAGAVGPGFFHGRHTIGLWWWEVEIFPEVMHGGFDHVDEVWAGSDHIAAAIGAAARARDVATTRVQIPVRRAAPTTRSRADLGLPEGFVFLNVFGYYSSVARKNPHGAIEAFARAFAPGEGPSLVIKCIDHEAHPAEHAALLAAAERHPDVHVQAGYSDRDEMDALVQRSDAIVSLHRAEGFGFTPAEAMAQGKPVIATRYSGNLDYMTSSNSLLIDGPLVPVGPNGGPYPADARWADPDLAAAAAAMRELVADPERAARVGLQAREDLARTHGAAACGETMRAALSPYADRHRWAKARLSAARLARGRRP
ncbi:MAG: glycosyltransferase family 4 protein [Solirubrobacteraceae bacterium]|nr:glycosyltransferase family 4 protein [Solirubrobacteraceae bacterium]